MYPAITSLLTIAGSAIAAYYGAYFKKRGEEKAIADGFAEVLRQTRKMTEATKAIEAQISDEVWSRQRQWESKREVLFECTKQAIAARFGIAFLEDQYSNEAGPADQTEARNKARADGVESFDEVIEFLRANTALAQLMCGDVTTDFLYEYADVAVQLARLIINHTESDDSYLETRDDLWQRADILSDEVMMAIRYELGIPPPGSPTIKPLPNGSSAHPSPGS